jgi:hypothetical protein
MATVTATIEKRVFDNLNNALDNGYDMSDKPLLHVVEDLLTFADYDFPEGETAEDEMMEAVDKWQKQRKQM